MKIYQIVGEGIRPHNNSSSELDYYSSEEKARKALIKQINKTNKWIDEEDSHDIYGEPTFEKYLKVDRLEYATTSFRYYIKEINVLD